MGIPYSKEINKAFDELNVAYGQVTPLVAAAYEVLETTKNIALILLAIEILTVVLLGLILLALVGLMITMSPDLQRERKELVTPVLRWVVRWAGMGVMGWTAGVLGVVLMIYLGLVAWSRWSSEKIDVLAEYKEDRENEREGNGEGEEEGEGKGEKEAADKTTDKEGEKEAEK